MTTTPPRIDPRLGAAALRAPAASREDSRPQAILKLHRPSSLDYRARQGLPVVLQSKNTRPKSKQYLHLVSFISNGSFERPVDQITIFCCVAYFSLTIL